MKSHIHILVVITSIAAVLGLLTVGLEDAVGLWETTCVFLAAFFLMILGMRSFACLLIGPDEPLVNTDDDPYRRDWYNEGR